MACVGLCSYLLKSSCIQKEKIITLHGLLVQQIKKIRYKMYLIRCTWGRKSVCKKTLLYFRFLHLEEQSAVTMISFIEQNRKQKTDADIWKARRQSSREDELMKQ